VIATISRLTKARLRRAFSLSRQFVFQSNARAGCANDRATSLQSHAFRDRRDFLGFAVFRSFTRWQIYLTCNAHAFCRRLCLHDLVNRADREIHIACAAKGELPQKI